ncbi:MAG: arabinose isomerase [Kiritimatiellae bacterium]|nr:arabinose isomerase [Kiritimatiellia bacterium]
MSELHVPRRKPLRAHVGVISMGHHTYWAQFPGLLDEMRRKTAVLVGKLEGNGVTVSDFGLLDRAEAAYAAIPNLKAADLDLLFVDKVTYATSATFGPLLHHVHIPMVLVALQPLAALDYARASTRMQLCNDDICSVPEFCGVAMRMGARIPPLVLGTLEGDAAADAELAEWCAVARVLHDLRRARIGHMGHVLENMYDMHTDPVALTRTFGLHAVQCEPDEILAHYPRPDADAVRAMRQRILDFFDTPDPGSDPITEKLSDAHLEVASRAAVALERFVDERALDGLAYYYEAMPGSPMRELMTNLIVGNSLLTAAGFPMCGEYDIKNCVAMLIMDRLGIGGSFAEFHPVDFENDTVLVGHDGPHHLNIADRKPVLRSLKVYHGKPGTGAGVEFSIRTGPITMLSIGVKADGSFKFVLAEGESECGPIPPTGNTNTHGRFKPDVRTFLKRWVAEGPTHHFALGIGHHARAIERVAGMLGVESVVVSPEQ